MSQSVPTWLGWGRKPHLTVLLGLETQLADRLPYFPLVSVYEYQKYLPPRTPAGSQIDRYQDSSECYYLGKQGTDPISIKAIKL